MDLRHEIMANLKAVALQMGRLPSEAEYWARSDFSKKQVFLFFANYGLLVQAAGLADGRDKHKYALRREIGEIFKETPRKIYLQGTKEKILCLGDTHFPFAHREAIEFVTRFAKDYKPDVIVQVGDLYDMYAHSKFPRSLWGYDPRQELQLGREMAEELWGKLECKRKYQLLGNHCVRPIKRLLENYPAGELFFEFAKWFEFPGVETLKSEREILKIGSANFMHGHLGKLGAHMEKFLMNVVCGHTHRGGVVFKALEDRILWELNCGYLGDETTKALGYQPTKIASWTLGLGTIDKLGPRFIALG